MYLSIPAGATSKIIQIPIFDSSSAIGAMLAGLVYTSSGLTAYYNREGAAGAATAITLATATKGTWATRGFVAVDGTNTPGWYELHIPNAALATGAKSVVVHLKGAANMVPVPIIIELTETSNQDAVRGGMTALPASGTLAVNPVLAATQTGVTIPTVTTVTNAPSDMALNSTVMKTAGYTVPDNASVAAVKVQTDKLAFTAAGKVDANVLMLNGDATALSNLAKSASVIYQGSVTGAATTTTLIDSALTQAAADFWKGRIVIFTSGVLKYQATDVTAFDPATDKLTFTALTAAPGAGDTYAIV